MDELELIRQHDELLAKLPEGSSHEAETCPFCNPKEEQSKTDERGEMEYTQSELDAAVNAAIAPLQAELSSLKGAEAQSAFEAQITTVREEAAAEVQSLKAELDAAILRADVAEQAQTDLVAFLESAQAELELAAAKETLKEERTNALLEQTSLNKDRIASRIEDIASMSDDEFEAYLSDLAAISVKKDDEASEQASAETSTAIRNIREETASSEAPFLARMNSLVTAAEDSKVSLNGLSGH